MLTEKEAKLLSACTHAYLRMLQLPHDTFRMGSQKELAELREAIAFTLETDPEIVQTCYERYAHDNNIV